MAKYTKHINHGQIKLAGNKKMSSRLGNFITPSEVMDISLEEIAKYSPDPDPKIALAAIKYSFLKQKAGPDVVYSPESAVQIQGNSGPYLLYSLVRAKSIIVKANQKNVSSQDSSLDPAERLLSVYMARFNDIIMECVNNLNPSLLCTYLYELSKEFNSFYEKNRILESPRQLQRLYLLQKYLEILKKGLSILNIEEVEKI